MRRGSSLAALALAAACSSPMAGGGGDDGVDAGELPTGDGGVDLTDPEWPEDSQIPAEFDFPPYLNLLDATTVVVSWRTVAATTGVVRFGTTASYGDELASATAANLHHVTLAGLEPGQAYHYEVAVDGTTAIRKGVFVVPGSARTTWRFMHAGEYHAPSEVTNVKAFTAAIRAFRPHVIVESGDMVDDGNLLTHWRSYLRTSAPWIGNVLLLPSHSNHVNGDGGNANLKELFVIPNNERWYTTRVGQVEFFTIDSSYRDNSDLITVEMPWLEGEIARAHDGTDDPTFVIASWHFPACSSQYFSRQSERTWVHDNLVSRFKQGGGVDIILAAHDKYYERSTITGGIVHMITNIGNVSPEIPGGNHPACTTVKTARTSQSVGLFSVDGSALAVRVIDQTGAEIDAFTVTK